MSNKKINLTTKTGEKYCLEYTRETVKQLERLGFTLEGYAEKPMIMIPLAFRGAFLANHKYLKEKEIEEIYSEIGKKRDLNEQIILMISECYESLIDDSEEGNATWEIV